MKSVVIVGAGFGGLAAALELSRAGLDVTLLEAHVYPGGSAGTFYHKGYRFDAGATLAGGFAPGALMDRFSQRFGIDWEVRSASRAMQIHMPDQSVITRWTDPKRWKNERLANFGEVSEPFWRWQESTADILWNVATSMPTWPPQTMSDLINLVNIGWVAKSEVIEIVPDAFRPIAHHIKYFGEQLRTFIDAQLLISAQTTSQRANALYGAAALDLARQGVAHVPGGMGGLAMKLVHALERDGGKIIFRQEVTRVSKSLGARFEVETKRGKAYSADMVVFNLPPWNIAKILDNLSPLRLRNLPDKPRQGWGAFVAYVGLDSNVLAKDLALHHQVLLEQPFGEGNSIFLSVSPSWDQSRAPEGKRAITISTHTKLEPWWDLFNNDHEKYESRKSEYLERVLNMAERVFPDIRQGADLIMPGTPITFQQFTRRAWGWVGGFPQINLFQSWGPRIAKDLWMVGDTIFPGQSVPAVMLGGLRVAQTIVREAEKSHLAHKFPHHICLEKASD